ncbi:Utp14 protein-domain-containing protein [Obelidium mucronatum]|nr:Utp14 protein-domain-containing protein [Obelidium mucronatum]
MKLKKAAPAKKAVSVKQSREDKEEQRLLRSKRSMDAMEDYNAHEVSDVESEDDEDLDDDAAFNDSDEDRFGSHFAAASLAAKKAKTRTAVAEDDILNEDAASSKGRKRKGKEESEASEDEDEEEEEDWGSDAGDLDLSDMLGSGPAKAVPVNPEYSLKKKPVFNKNDPASVLLAKHSDDSNSEDEDADSLYESDENNLNESGDQFQSFVSNLDAKHAAKKRRVTLAESTEAYTESEFNLNSRSKSSLGSAKLDFSDLVGSLGGDSTFTHLRKQLTELAPGAVNTGKPGLRAEGTEAAPLPTRIQDRIGRQAAYQSAKKEVEKWSGIISRNRKAEQLDFTTLEEKPAAIVSSAALVGQFKPTTDMEQEIAQLLKDSALDEKKQMELKI